MAMHFDITDFRLLVRIAETGSLTRAAEKAYLSVPAASHRLKNLEDGLNLKLVVRSAQGATLTEAGKVYLRHARGVLAQLDLLTADLQELGAGIKGQARVFANATAITEFLPGMLAGYLKRHADVQLDLRERMSEDIVRCVRDGQADIGIISGLVPTDRLQALPLISSRLVVIAPRAHAVADAGQVHFKELLRYEFVSLPEGNSVHDFFAQQAAALHLPMTLRVQVASYDAICSMVESGAGIAIVPAPVVERLQLHGRVAVCELLDLWGRREFQIVAADFEALPRYCLDFVDELLAHLRPPPTGG